MDLKLSKTAKENLCDKQKSALAFYNNDYGNTLVAYDLVENSQFNPIQIVVCDAKARRSVAFLSLKHIDGVYFLAEFNEFDKNHLTDVQKHILVNRTRLWITKISDQENECELGK